MIPPLPLSEFARELAWELKEVLLNALARALAWTLLVFVVFVLEVWFGGGAIYTHAAHTPAYMPAYTP